jgi:NADH:ubiquinone oxidoreductase subunit F (NADH-binding)
VGGVGLILEHVEAGNARLLHAVAGIGYGGGLEGFEIFGSDVDMDVDDQHGDGSSICLAI